MHGDAVLDAYRGGWCMGLVKKLYKLTGEEGGFYDELELEGEWLQKDGRLIGGP